MDGLNIRKPDKADLPSASALCVRSKGYWGYDTSFLQACETELELTIKDIERDEVILAVVATKIAGVAQVSNGEDGCFLEKLFVDPEAMGRGIGRRLFDWSASTAKSLGADTMIVEADPGAVPFYKAMGCVEAGQAASGSIPGRLIPRLTFCVGD